MVYMGISQHGAVCWGISGALSLVRPMFCPSLKTRPSINPTRYDDRHPKGWTVINYCILFYWCLHKSGNEQVMFSPLTQTLYWFVSYVVQRCHFLRIWFDSDAIWLQPPGKIPQLYQSEYQTISKHSSGMEEVFFFNSYETLPLNAEFILFKCNPSPHKTPETRSLCLACSAVWWPSKKKKKNLSIITSSKWHHLIFSKNWP